MTHVTISGLGDECAKGPKDFFLLPGDAIRIPCRFTLHHGNGRSFTFHRQLLIEFPGSARWWWPFRRKRVAKVVWTEGEFGA